MIKKTLIPVACLSLLASCMETSLVDDFDGNYEINNKKEIGFIMSSQNMTKASSALNKSGHYNFGVFAYKSTEATNNIMENYLVGYSDANNNVGYKFGPDQSTQGDAAGVLNGASMWQYEGLGSTEYNYTGGEGYYTKDQTTYMSNVANQYLRFWDYSAPTTTFYAYAPYINGASSTAKYDNSTKTMTIPDASIIAGYNDPTNSEFMYAATNVNSSDYGHDVALQFKRLNAKVNVKFWEDIDGYSVRILNLQEGTYNDGVYAKPASVAASNTPGDYDVAKLYVKEGATINFSDLSNIVATPILSTTDESDACLTFTAPADAEIGTTRLLASASPTTYYAIPQPSTSTTGLTFHVSYELTSTTGEKIVVKDATVHVPVANVKWAANTHYTYVFKITANANGSTAPTQTIDPNNPDVPVEPALYPIIFDNCTVTEYDVIESDHIITDGTNEVNYSVMLDNTTIDATATSPGSVTPTLKEDGVSVASPAGSWSITPASATGLTFTTSTGVATFATNATAGIYTITYTPTAAEHAPATSYSASFEVIGNNALTLSTSEIGTGGLDATELTLTTSVNNVASTPITRQLEIVYPSTLTADQKNKINITNVGNPTIIRVEKDAIPGTYSVKYTTQEGTAQATFEVKNFGLTLSPNIVNHNNTDQIVTPSTVGATFGTDANLSLGDSYTGISIESDNTIKVVKTVAPGAYIIKNTVTKGSSVTVYEQVLTVQNDYLLSVNKTIIDNDGDATARTITFSASKNSVSETALTNIELKDPNGAAIALPSSGLTYEVPATAVLGTYTVNYKDGANVVKTVTFIVQD